MLGDSIRKIRKDEGMSINKLAKLADISLGYFYSIAKYIKLSLSKTNVGKVWENIIMGEPLF